MCRAPGRVNDKMGHNPVMVGSSPLGRAGEISRVEKRHDFRGLIRASPVFTGLARTTHAL